MGFSGFYLVLLGFTGFYQVFFRFYWVFLGLTGLYWILLGSTGFFWVLLGFPGFDLVWPGFNGFYLVFAWFYWVSLGFTGLVGILLGFTGFYCVLLGLNGFHCVLLGFTGFYWVSIDFTGLSWIRAFYLGIRCQPFRKTRTCLAFFWLVYCSLVDWTVASTNPERDYFFGHVASFFFRLIHFLLFRLLSSSDWGWTFFFFLIFWDRFYLIEFGSVITVGGFAVVTVFLFRFFFSILFLPFFCFSFSFTGRPSDRIGATNQWRGRENKRRNFLGFDWPVARWFGAPRPLAANRFG